MTVLDLSAADYHSDATGDDRPALSASIASILCSRSPLHAWTAHPKLNPDFRRVEEQKFDRGVVAHELLLRGIDCVHVVAADSWRTNAAKEERDEARMAGMVPLLTDQAAEVVAMVAAVERQLDALEVAPRPFTDGKPEQTLVWEDDAVLCKARLDWLRDDLTVIDDLKTTSRSAHPDAYSRALYGVGGDIQAAFYLRGRRAFLAGGGDPREIFPPVDGVFRWVVCETAPPYAVSVITPHDAVLELANRKIDHALKTWNRCLVSGDWPGYPARVAIAALPAWEEARWLDREALEEEVAAA